MLNITELSALEIVSAPRSPEGDATSSSSSAARTTAAVIAAHGELAGSAGKPLLLTIRMREPGSGRLRFLAAAAPGLSTIRESVIEPGRWTLPFPPGTVTVALPPGSLARSMGQLGHWVRCLGDPDPLWHSEDRNAPQGLGGTFAQHTAHLRHPFAWLVVAEPLGVQELEGELSQLELGIPRLRARASTQHDRLGLERAEERFRELIRARTRGAWRVHILVGGSTPGQARAASRVLSAACELHCLPYAISPGEHVASFEDTWESTARSPQGLGATPFIAGAELVAALLAAPDVELPGIRLQAPNPFDVTPEEAAPASVNLGTVLDSDCQPAGAMAVSLATLNRHTFIAGATGSGKSQTTRHLLEQLSFRSEPIPWLVIEPAKAEYAAMAGRLADRAQVLRIRPGDLACPPASLNPLEPAHGFPLQSHLDLVRALFLASFQAEEPFPQVLALALSRTYEDAGWDLVSSRPRPQWEPAYTKEEQRIPATPHYPGLDDLQAAARTVVDEIGYGREVAANVRGFIDVRIGSLLVGSPGRFFRGGHPLDIRRLLSSNVVIELEGVSDDQDKAFMMGSIIIRLVEHLRTAKRESNRLHHVTVIEEAHRLLKVVKEGPGASSVELFASLLAEIRAYGEGIVVVEQIPSKIIPDVVKNTALKILHRLPAQDDRETVGATINLSELQSEYVVSLRPGLAAASVDGADRPLLICVDDGSGRESVSSITVTPPMAGRRSTMCAPDCRETEQSACTLDQINEADHIAKHALIRVWTEAVSIAYLTGLKLPGPHLATLAVLGNTDTRVMHCALAHTVELSLATRRSALRRYIQADAFGGALHLQLRRQASTGEAAPVPEYRRWLVGPYRWSDIELSLRKRLEVGLTTVEEELLAKWRARGAHLHGDDISAHLQSLCEQAGRQPIDAVLGNTRSTGLEAAVDELSGQADLGGVRYALKRACRGPFEALAHEMARGLKHHRPQ